MPTYEYRCTQCQRVFDCIQGVGDPAPACQKCGSPTRKVFSSVGLIFKGKGFYTTDHRKPAPSDGETGAAPKDAPAKETTPASKDAASSSKDTASSTKDSSTPSKDAASSKGGSSSASSASDS
ncbi:MAG: FmdB family zinc ribbon protein [Armatimonadota bacterium]